MKQFAILHKSSFYRKYATSILAFSWTLGLAFGLCALAADTSGTAFHQAVSLSPSLFSIISVLLLPMVLSLLAVFAGVPWLIFPLAFLKALSFAYVGWSVVIAYGSAGWLVRLLFMFSDCACVPILWWFWCRALTSESDALLPASLAAALTVLGIGIVDYGVISPFLVNLSL